MNIFRQRVLVQVVAVALAAGFACTPELPDPILQALEPDWGYNGESTEISVAGQQFYPRVEIDAGDDGGHLDRQFALRLEGLSYTGASVEAALEGVELVSYQELRGVVPQGIPVGRYDLVLVAPTGVEVRADEAFTVTDTRADHLTFDVASSLVTVNEPFSVAFDLLDPESLPVAQDLAVRLEASTDEGVILEIDAGQLEDAVDLEPPAVGVEGSLGDDGHGQVTITASTPGSFSLDLSPVDTESFVTGDNLLLTVLPGDLETVQVTLPSENFSAVAGESFEVELTLLDAYGNPLEEDSAVLVLSETCGTYQEQVTVVGSTTIDVAVTGATVDSCPENHVNVLGGASGQSEPFDVTANEAAVYRVTTYPATVTAAVDPLYVTVEAEDAYGNASRDYTGTLELSDTLGGLDVSAGLGEQSCNTFSEGVAICIAFPWVAGLTEVTATGEDGLSGLSETVEVTPGELYDFYLTLDAGPFAAGVTAEMLVQPVDAYANIIPIDPTVDIFSFSVTSGGVDCSWDGNVFADGSRLFDCGFTVAGQGELLEVTVPSLGPTSATTDAFDVVNGELASVEFDISTGFKVTAGEAFDVGLTGLDAYGNPYLEQTDPLVGLTDITATLSESSVPLDAQGEAQLNVTVTGAFETNVIIAWQGGVELGRSEEFEVDEADLDSLSLTMDKAWAFVGEERSLTVVAIDAYGNPIEDFAESVDVATAAGSESFQLDTFFAGEATITISFDAARIGDTFVAESDVSAATGTYTPLDVLEESCGVSAGLLLNGTTEPSVCRVSGSASVTADASTSASALLYHYASGAGESARTSSTNTVFTYAEAGSYDVELVAFDSDACGAYASSTLFVGDSDGEPVGVVTVLSDNTALVNGSSTPDGEANITFMATDCAGDPAVGGTLFVRANLAEWSSGLTATGSGLSLTLDSAGEGIATLSSASEIYAASASVIAGRSNGTAIGSTTVELMGDQARPSVQAVDPFGATNELFDEVIVRFTEPMWTSAFSFNDTNITLNGPGGAVALDSFSFDDDDREVIIALVEEQDAASGAYTLSLTSDVRDAAGNRLDGAWSGSADDFSFNFGSVGDTAPNVASCVADTSILRPDGDDVAASAEADVVEVEVSAPSAPVWWYVEIQDDSGGEVRTDWVAATAATETILWDARGADGVVVENGDYDLRVRAMDANLNQGLVCSVSVTVDNFLVGTE